MRKTPKKAPRSPSKPSKPREAPSVAPMAPDTFQARWEALTTREKNLVRFAADQKGVTLATLLEKFPQYRHQA